jgi:hypothetical protein
MLLDKQVAEQNPSEQQDRRRPRLREHPRGSLLRHGRELGGRADRELGAFALDLIDPAAPELAASQDDGVGISDLRRRIGRADAIVIVTPEYNHGYPAPLKALIDSVNAEWQAKPVAFVPTAESPAGCAPSSSCAWSSPKSTRSPSGTA